MSESQSVGAIKNNCMTSMAACVLCGKGPVDSEVDSSEDDDDTLCSKLEPYKCAAHPFALYFVFC